MNSFNNNDGWKNTIGKAIHIGENFGLSDTTITNITESVGNFISKNIDPKNDETKLLKELWDVANEHDKHVLAKLIVKMTKDN
jgi:hypothetical protein